MEFVPRVVVSMFNINRSKSKLRESSFNMTKGGNEDIKGGGGGSENF